MQRFLQRHAGSVMGTLSGFDRLRFRGTLRLLAHAGGMMNYLWQRGVLLKTFKEHAQWATEQIRRGAQALAERRRAALDLSGRQFREQGGPGADRRRRRPDRGRTDLRPELRRAVPLVRDSSQPPGAEAGPPQCRDEVPPLLFLLPASATGIPARAAADVVSVHDARVPQRPRMAGAADGRRRSGLRPSRQLLRRIGGPARPSGCSTGNCGPTGRNCSTDSPLRSFPSGR